MRRKFLTVLLALAATLCLCFGLAACGEEAPQDPSGGDDLWTAERLYAEAKARGFEGSFDDLVALFKGADGKDGQNGVGIQSAEIGDDGHLYLTLTDGNVLDAGEVSGAPAQIEGTEGLAYHMRRSPTGEETLEVVGIGIAYDLDIVIPATYRGIPVTAIADNAFSGCSDLTSVKIGENVSSIGNGAFLGCTSLTSIKIPDGVTSIGDSAFYECSGLKGVYITNLAAWCRIEFEIYSNYVSSNPLSYAHHLYLDNVEVKDLIIPAEIKEIKQYAFYGCSGFESVTIGSGVTSIGYQAFYGCSGLESIMVDTNNKNYSSQDGILYNKEKTEFVHIPQAIKGDVNIPNGVISIGDNAFTGCRGLESVTIGNGVTSIGHNAFWECAKLTSVTIGENVASIGYQAFLSCDNLNSVSFVNPNGWSVDGTALLSDALQNATTAAKYLRDFYCWSTWTRQ